MTISEVYRKYQIMPQLRLHQYRVAAVAQLVCENMQIEVDTHEIVAADLIHDMGNIIKFNLTMFPEYLQPEGLDFWKVVRQDFIERYGEDEHVATSKIAHELKLSPRVIELVESIGFAKSKQITESQDFGIKICAYADRRVAPNGIVSMQEREQNGRSRYIINKGLQKDDQHFQELYEASVENETQIFAKCKIRPEGVNDVSCLSIIEGLQNFSIN